MKNLLKNNKILTWLTIGVVIRLILMPITLHPDLWGHSFTAYFFAYKGVFNIYDHLLTLSPTHPLVTNFGVSDIFIYPPLTYYTFGLFRVLVKPFIDPNFIPWLFENLSIVHQRRDLSTNLFLFKLPYLFIDIFLGLLISKLFTKTKNQTKAFMLWMLNPVTLYATFMMGQFDILPALFTVLSLYFASKKKYTYSLLALGLGGSYKLYPLFFVIPAALLFSDSLKDRIKKTLIGFAPFILFSLPFLGSAAYRQLVLFTPKSQKMLYMTFNVSDAEGLYPFIIGLVLIYFACYYFSKRIHLLDVMLAILLLTYSITHYHPQWFLWITPLLLIKLIKSNFKHTIIVFTLFACWLYITLSFDASLSYGMFNPIFPDLKNATDGLSEVVNKYSDANMVKSVVRSIFAGTSIFYLIDIFKINKSIKSR